MLYRNTNTLVVECFVAYYNNDGAWFNSSSCLQVELFERLTSTNKRLYCLRLFLCSKPTQSSSLLFQNFILLTFSSLSELWSLLLYHSNIQAINELECLEAFPSVNDLYIMPHLSRSEKWIQKLFPPVEFPLLELSHWNIRAASEWNNGLAQWGVTDKPIISYAQKK